MNRPSVKNLLILIVALGVFLPAGPGCGKKDADREKKTENLTDTGTPVSKVTNDGKKTMTADTKKSALEILKGAVKIDAGYEFTDAAMEEGRSGYRWDDGSYYAFTVRDRETGDMGDIGRVYLVKKNTAELYVIDLERDPAGNILKKYRP